MYTYSSEVKLFFSITNNKKNLLTWDGSQCPFGNAKYLNQPVISVKNSRLAAKNVICRLIKVKFLNSRS